MIYLAAELADQVTGTYAVTRRNAPTLANGIQVQDPAPVTLEIQAVVQPASALEIQRLSEGRRSTDLRAIFTSVALYAQSDANAADQVAINGDLYEVSEVEAWGNGQGSDYWRSLALRVGRLNAGQP